MIARKWQSVLCCILLAALWCTTARAGDVYSYQYTIIPHEVKSIMATLCNSSTRSAAQKAYEAIAAGGYDQMLDTMYANADKYQTKTSRIGKIDALKETLMFAVVGRMTIDRDGATSSHAREKGGKDGLVRELDGVIARTLDTLCVHISNLDKIIYRGDRQINPGPYKAVVKKLEQSARESGSFGK